MEKIGYDSDLPYEKAEKLYEEVMDTFNEVQGKYPMAGGAMAEDDLKTLSECTGVLLPLQHQPSVQENARQSEDPLLFQISDLNTQILLYIALFNNTPVELIP